MYANVSCVLAYVRVCLLFPINVHACVRVRIHILVHLYDSTACNVEVNNTFAVKKIYSSLFPTLSPPAFHPRTSTLQCREKMLSSPPSTARPSSSAAAAPALAS